MNSQKRNQKICLKEFIPERVINAKNTKSFEVQIWDTDINLTVWYSVMLNQKGLIYKKEYEILIPRYIKRNSQTFEVLGLLQAEMGKKQDGKVTFCNHEYKLINKVMTWFEKQFEFPLHRWKWYIKVNINEPIDTKYKKKVEEKVINHWIRKSGLSLQQSYPKKVSYVKKTNSTKLGFCDYGSLIIEHRGNLFSQIVKNLVRNMSQNILCCETLEIRDFMRGIIAGESNVEVHIRDKRYRVFISAKESEERNLYQQCLTKLGINSIQYKGFRAIIISKKHNNLELLKQKLMTLSPQKYNKFLRMMKMYGEFDGLTVWNRQLQKPHNKLPESTIEKILKLHNEHPDWPAWRIATLVGVSDIKVQRVRKGNDLGRRIKKTPETLRQRIADYAMNNPNLKQYEVAQTFNVHASVVGRAVHKYGKKSILEDKKRNLFKGMDVSEVHFM